MKNILCFGDSNTYGESPEGFGRYTYQKRWPGILQQFLGNKCLVIEEGLNGRTTVWDDPVEGDKNGLKHLPVCLSSHSPLDLIILMLGTNDLKHRFTVTPLEIAMSIERLVHLTQITENGRREYPPEILLVAPTCVNRQTFLGEVFGDRHEDSLRLGKLYQEVADRNSAHFINAAEVSLPSALDGLHFDRDGHKKMANAIYKKVTSILFPEQKEDS